MARFKTPRCRAKFKDTCPFHGDTFADNTEQRLGLYQHTVKEYGLPKNLSVTANNWNMRETIGFASAIVANAHSNLDFAVKAPMLNYIGNEKSDMGMLANSTSAYNVALQRAEQEFKVQKAQQMSRDTDEATKIGELSHYVSSQIFTANAQADRIRHQMQDKQHTLFADEHRKHMGASEAQLLAQEALAFRLTEVRDKLDKQLKRSAKQSPPPLLPSAEWFEQATAEDLHKAAKTEPRIPVDWMAPLPGEKAPEPFNW